MVRKATETKPLRDLCSKVKTGLSSPYFKDGDTTVKVVKAKDIDERGRLLVDQVDTSKVKWSPAVDNCRLVPGDIIISLKGSTFKIAIIPEEAIDFVISANLVSLSLKPVIKPEIVSFFLRSSPFTRTMQNLAATGGMPSLRTEHLLGIEIPVPTLEKQNELYAYILEVEELYLLLEEEMHSISRLSDAIVCDMIGRIKR
ncbi:MAG: type I restriction enzyme, S subunit [Methanolobus sp. T82-4]|nr:MAG: type I restriction enzyme, S subunit [Methanolobus sp. T82-4]